MTGSSRFRNQNPAWTLAGFPLSEQTAEGPAYQGRLLVRPDSEVVDQGIGFDMMTLTSRRKVLGLLGLGATSILLAACAQVGQSAAPPAPAPVNGETEGAVVPDGLPSAEIPEEYVGPNPGDGSNGPDVLERSGVVRSNIRSSIGSDAPVDGVPLTFTLRITNIEADDAPFVGVAVYVWHCDARGRYSMYSRGAEQETWLRGVQVSDAQGEVVFTSIVPGCYPGRWPHVHFEVYSSVDSIVDSANAIATSEFTFPEAVLNAVYERPGYDRATTNLARLDLATDNAFGDNGGVLQTARVTGDATTGYEAALSVRIDPRTRP